MKPLVFGTAVTRFYSSWNGGLDPEMDPDSIPTVPFGLLTSLVEP